MSSAREIAIRVTGPRPGEKLTEDLCDPAEPSGPTAHPPILRATPADVARDLDAGLDDLDAVAERGDDAAAARVLAEVAGLGADDAASTIDMTVTNRT